MNSIQALKWSFLSEIASKAIQPIIFIVLARFLAPEDFGVMSAALMVLGLSQIIWDAGMSKALIQHQSNIDEASNTAYWINIGLGCLISLILYNIARPVALTFFHDERVTQVLQIMTLQIFLGAESATYIALLQKELEFRKLFWVRCATVTLPGLASIPLALMGMGYWALVIGTLVGQLVQVFILRHVSCWHPRCSFNLCIAKEMGKFGAWVSLSGILSWFYIWADSLIVGIYLGSHELGLYRTGNQLASMIFTILFGPITPVIYSHLSKLNLTNIQLGKIIEKIIKILILFAIPVAFIIFSLAEPIADIIFDDKWVGISLVIGVMALVHGFGWIVGMNGEIYRVMGKPSYESVVMGTTILIYLGTYILSIQHGFAVFVWSRLFLAQFGVLLHLFVLRKILSINIQLIVKFFFRYSALVVAVVSSVYFFVNYNVTHAWWQLVIGILFNVSILGILIFHFEWNGALKGISTNRSKKLL